MKPQYVEFFRLVDKKKEKYWKINVYIYINRQIQLKYDFYQCYLLNYIKKILTWNTWQVACNTSQVAWAFWSKNVESILNKNIILFKKGINDTKPG
jgi:hypothetical protein